MSQTNTTPLLAQTGVTSATFESLPPYEWGWASSGALSFYLDNWGNVDNTLMVDVYWGTQIKGVTPVNANIVWEKDLLLSRTFTATAGTTADLPGVVDIPKVRGRYMKLGFTLAGTSKTVDITCYFHAKEGTGFSEVIPEPTVYQDAGSATNLVAKSSAGRVLNIVATNANAAVRYLQLFNRATTLSGGETALVWFLMPAGTAAAPAVIERGSEFWGKYGKLFDTGITWGVSTTATTFTAATAGEHTTTIVRL